MKIKWNLENNVVGKPAKDFPAGTFLRDMDSDYGPYGYRVDDTHILWFYTEDIGLETLDEGSYPNCVELPNAVLTIREQE